jgi:hypothetical protein
MVAAKRKATAAQPEREYPTEWTMYPAGEEDARQGQQDGEQINQAETTTIEPHRFTGSSSDRRTKAS